MTFMKPAYFDVTRHSFVAFLDGDLIAVSEWTSIFNSLGEFAIGACKEDNMFEFERAWAPHLPTGWYINAGVLSAQPRIWQARYSDKWRGLLANYPNFGFKLLEQDLMNAALLGETAPINAELNVRPAYGHPLKDASIVHYAGWWKPWLTVDSEVKALTPVMLESLVLYKRAEAAFEEHLTLGFESSEARFWARAKTEVRGRLNWRAHWRYRRWDGTRRARRLLSSIRSVSRS
jgi:lipopolysaccharide biosynthesis glycosyltransferase